MRVLVTGGGTGGHVFPLIAVIEEIKRLQPNSHFHWFGSRRLEWQVVPETDISGTFLPFTFSYRKMNVANLIYYMRTLPMWLTGYPVRSAMKVIDDFEPDIVLASGGYVSVPALAAAVIKGIQIALLEVNSVPGRANFLFASSARIVLCSTEEAAQKIYPYASPGSVRVVGFPARKFENFDPFEYFRIPESIPLVIISGGSLGAEHINHVLLRSAEDPEFVKTFGESVAIVHQWGRIPTEKEHGRFVTFKFYRAIAFDPKLPALYKNASLFIGRAGAATICDLVGAKLPSILIPYPSHKDKHQYLNAQLLAQLGCSKIVEETDFMPDTLSLLLKELVLEGAGRKMRDGFSRLQDNGARRAADEIIALMENID